MEELSVRIKIADREYPMKVKPEDEETIRNAGKVINKKIKFYRDEFGIDDKQDLLAMVAFDCLVEKMNSEGGYTASEETILQQLTDLNKLVSSVV